MNSDGSIVEEAKYDNTSSEAEIFADLREIIYGLSIVD